MNEALRRVVAFTTGLALFAAAPVAMAKPTDPKAIELGKQGNEHFKDGDFEAAKASFEAAYEIEPDAAFLFGMGQALNQLGDCRAAIRKYNQVKESPSAAVELRQLADQAIIACAEKVANEEPGPATSGEPSDEPVGEDPVGEPDVEPTEIPDDETPRPRKWYQDPLGDTLVAVGLAGTGAGVGLLVAAQVEQGKDATSYESFDAQIKKVRTLRIAGGVTLGIGGALLIGGIVRWVVVGLRPKASATARLGGIGVLYDGSTTGLSLSGRF